MRGISRVRLIVGLLAVILLTASTAAVEETGFTTSGARSSLSGLMLHATLPYDHYGPRDQISIYLTFYNSSRTAVKFPKDAPLLVEVAERKKLLSFTPREAPLKDTGETANTNIVLQPGETFLRRVVLEWKKNSFLPGEHDMRIYCLLDGTGAAGKKSDKAVLKSNTVVLNIKYEVIMVY